MSTVSANSKIASLRAKVAAMSPEQAFERFYELYQTAEFFENKDLLDEAALCFFGPDTDLEQAVLPPERPEFDISKAIRID